ncbi:MAG: dockerin type I repeat-containing protein [Ruminococcus sp.]
MICRKLKKLIIVNISLLFTIMLFVVCAVSVGAVPSDNAFSGTDSILYGDANNDGKVDIRDCTYIQKCINKSVVPQDNNYYMTVADLNQDSRVNIKDTTILQKYINGLYSSLPITTDTPRPTVIYTSTTPTTTVPVNDDEGYNNIVYKP